MRSRRTGTTRSGSRWARCCCAWATSSAAEDAFRASLVQAPNNGWALFGLSETYRRMGRAGEAAAIGQRLDEAWAGDRGLLDLGRL